jgi:hypothetical protein
MRLHNTPWSGKVWQVRELESLLLGVRKILTEIRVLCLLTRCSLLVVHMVVLVENISEYR